MPNLLQQNAPVTATTIVSAVGLMLASFTDMTAEQVTAILAVVAIVAAFAVQRWGTNPEVWPQPEPEENP